MQTYQEGRQVGQKGKNDQGMKPINPWSSLAYLGGLAHDSKRHNFDFLNHASGLGGLQNRAKLEILAKA